MLVAVTPGVLLLLELDEPQPAMTSAATPSAASVISGFLLSLPMSLLLGEDWIADRERRAAAFRYFLFCTFQTQALSH
jgi:hypothetical protein